MEISDRKNETCDVAPKKLIATLKGTNSVFKSYILEFAHLTVSLIICFQTIFLNGLLIVWSLQT